MGYSLITYSKDCMATEGKKPHPSLPWKDKSGKPQEPHWTGHQETPYYRLKHSFDGFVTELGELYDSVRDGFKDLTNMFEEIGDLWWYFGIYADQVAISAAMTPNQREEFFGRLDERINLEINDQPSKYEKDDVAWFAFALIKYVGNGIDVCKRTEYYRTKDVDYARIIAQLEHIAEVLVRVTFSCIENSQWPNKDDVDQRETLELVWRSNIAKLYKRFGDKFSAETAAAVRDVEAERAAIVENT